MKTTRNADDVRIPDVVKVTGHVQISGELAEDLRRAETAEAEAVRLTLEVERLKRALNDLAEAAEVAAQGGIHGALIDGKVSE